MFTYSEKNFMTVFPFPFQWAPFVGKRSGGGGGRGVRWYKDDNLLILKL